MGKKKSKGKDDAPGEEPNTGETKPGMDEEPGLSDDELLEEMGEASGEAPNSDAAAGEGSPSAMLLFGRWPTVGIEVKDKGLQRYINLREIFIPHFGGAFSKKRFWKHKSPIIERLANRIMTPGSIRARVKGRRSAFRAGKKIKAFNIIRRAFELVYLKTNENPVQVLAQAIERSAPREDTTRISMGGISYQSSVDVAPSRRVDMALHYLSLGSTRRSYNSPATIEECLADEIIAAAKGDQSSFAVSRKEEKERVAFSAR